MEMNNLRAVFLVMVLLGLPSIAWDEQEIIGKISEINDTIYKDYRNFYTLENLEDLGASILGELTLGLYVQDKNTQTVRQRNSFEVHLVIVYLQAPIPFPQWRALCP